MRVLFLTTSGHAYSDKVGLNFDNIQEPDGIHPLTNKAVYTDEHKRESLTFITARSTVPIGDSRTFDRMYELIFERTLMMVARRSHRVSRIWHRRFINAIYLIFRLFYFGWMLGLVTLGIYIAIKLMVIL